MKLAFISGIAGIVLSGFAWPAHSQQNHGSDHAMPQDTRQVVHFPEGLRIHTLANMRDHLLALQQINEALAKQEFEEVARISESRLGSTSLEAHGAHQLAPYMPKGMQDFGSAMHVAASRLAIVAMDAGATGDHRPTLAALGQVMKQCVACHAAYRLQ